MKAIEPKPIPCAAALDSPAVVPSPKVQRFYSLEAGAIDALVEVLYALLADEPPTRHESQLADAESTCFSATPE
jgi:hypothetical protein